MNKVYAIYIFNQEGRYIFQQNLVQNSLNPSLITGMLTAIQGVLKEITNSFPSLIISGKYAFNFEKIGKITICTVTKSDIVAQEYLSEIGAAFIKKYGGKIDNWNGSLLQFNDFSNDLEQIIKTKLKGRKDPVNTLNAFSMLTLSDDLNRIIRRILNLGPNIGKVEIAKIAETENILESQVIDALENLVNLGYLGTVETEEGLMYIT